MQVSEGGRKISKKIIKGGGGHLDQTAGKIRVGGHMKSRILMRGGGGGGGGGDSSLKHLVVLFLFFRITDTNNMPLPQNKPLGQKKFTIPQSRKREQVQCHIRDQARIYGRGPGGPDPCPFSIQSKLCPQILKPI